MSRSLESARLHLSELRLELAAAEAAGLTDVPAYRNDIVAELAWAQAAYVTAAVTEIASFRAQLSGPQVG